MRFTPLAALAALATLAACSDAPLTQADPAADPSSQIVFLEPSQYAANGITPTPMPERDGRAPSMLVQPVEPCYDPYCPEPEPEPLPQARLDYFTSSTKTNNGTEKTIELWTYQQAHNNMDYMTLKASYQYVNAQEWKGCGATPYQYSSDSKIAYGAPTELTGSRFQRYPSFTAFVWRIKVDHFFKANPGYVVYGTANSRTFGSSHTACW